MKSLLKRDARRAVKTPRSRKQRFLRARRGKQHGVESLQQVRIVRNRRVRVPRHDQKPIFEPIHRILFNAGDFQKELDALDGNGQLAYAYSQKGGKKAIKTTNSAAETYQIIQKLIDKNLKERPEMKVDFIHDESSVLEIADKNPDSLAIVMPALGKSDIFEFVAKDMVLPRKSFSMGHASEKRYYLEAKKIA